MHGSPRGHVVLTGGNGCAHRLAYHTSARVGIALSRPVGGPGAVAMHLHGVDPGEADRLDRAGQPRRAGPEEVHVDGVAVVDAGVAVRPVEPDDAVLELAHRP